MKPNKTWKEPFPGSRPTAIGTMLARLLRCGAMGLGAALAGVSPGIASMPPLNSPPEKIFISGHSLTNRPFPEYLERIVRTAGMSISWNRQYLEGSTIQQRTSGGPGRSGWEGYRSGIDRDDRRIDSLAELTRAGQSRETQYDALVITERNSLLSEVLWYDTIRALRNYQDAFVARSPGGRTFFFEPWYRIDKDEPRRWISYEASASTAWGCVTTAVNASLEVDGRQDRIVSVPVALGLAHLVESSLGASRLPGLGGRSDREVLDRLFSDNVHPTPAGAYYTALFFFAKVWGRSPVGAWAPDDMDPDLVRTLQRTAASAAERTHGNAGMDLASCRSYMGWSFQWTFWPYMNDMSLREDLGFMKSRLVLVKHIATSLRYFWRNAPPNPFADPQVLKGHYWLPPPS
jgi:hypothetical protein